MNDPHIKGNIDPNMSLLRDKLTGRYYSCSLGVFVIIGLIMLISLVL